MASKAKSIPFALLSCMAAVPAANVQAQSELQLQIPYYFYEDVPLEDEAGITLGYGYRFDNPFGLELSYTYAETALESPLAPDADYEHAQLNGLVHFAETEAVHPFLMLGIGHIDTDYGPGWGDSTLASTFGVGSKFDFSDNWHLRTDARYFHTDEGSDDFYSVNLGLAYVFGAGGSDAPAKTQPAKPEVQDADEDGVEDRYDRCPGTPVGVAVDKNGCALDDDEDGVPNYKDECPDTEAGLKVDPQGCAVVLEETVSIDLEVYFDTNSADVKRVYYPEIRRVAKFLGEYAGTTAVIEGHTDVRGSASYNKELSQKRADAVRNVLVQDMGVDPARVKAVGYGEERPLRTENTADAHEANRRVVANISANVEKKARK